MRIAIHKDFRVCPRTSYASISICTGILIMIMSFKFDTKLFWHIFAYRECWIWSIVHSQEQIAYILCWTWNTHFSLEQGNICITTKHVIKDASIRPSVIFIWYIRNVWYSLGTVYLSYKLNSYQKKFLLRYLSRKTQPAAMIITLKRKED